MRPIPTAGGAVSSQRPAHTGSSLRSAGGVVTQNCDCTAQGQSPPTAGQRDYTHSGAPELHLGPASLAVLALIGKEATPLPSGVELSHAHQLESWPIGKKVWLSPASRLLAQGGGTSNPSPKEQKEVEVCVFAVHTGQCSSRSDTSFPESSALCELAFLNSSLNPSRRTP